MRARASTLSSGHADGGLLQRLRQNSRDLVALVLAPVAAAALSDRLAHRLLNRLARDDWYFERPGEAVAAAYAAWTGSTPEASWVHRHRRLELRDRSDALRAWTSSTGGYTRMVHLAGDAIPPAPFVGITLHYGAGLWSLRALRERGIRASFMSIPMRRQDYPGRPLMYWFECARNFIAARLGNASVTYSADSYAQLKALLAAGHSIIGMLDVPGVSPKYRRTVDLLGRVISLPTGLTALAREQNVPILAFYVRERVPGGGLELVTRVIESGATDPFDQTWAFFRNALERDSAPWHAWSWPSPSRAFDARPPNRRPGTPP